MALVDVMSLFRLTAHPAVPGNLSRHLTDDAATFGPLLETCSTDRKGDDSDLRFHISTKFQPCSRQPAAAGECQGSSPAAPGSMREAYWNLLMATMSPILLYGFPISL